MQCSLEKQTQDPQCSCEEVIVTLVISNCCCQRCDEPVLQQLLYCLLPDLRLLRGLPSQLRRRRAVGLHLQDGLAWLRLMRPLPGRALHGFAQPSLGTALRPSSCGADLPAAPPSSSATRPSSPQALSPPPFRGPSLSWRSLPLGAVLCLGARSIFCTLLGHFRVSALQGSQQRRSDSTVLHAAWRFLVVSYISIYIGCANSIGLSEFPQERKLWTGQCSQTSQLACTQLLAATKQKQSLLEGQREADVPFAANRTLLLQAGHGVWVWFCVQQGPGAEKRRKKNSESDDNGDGDDAAWQQRGVWW